jgi:hypothetical protein
LFDLNNLRKTLKFFAKPIFKKFQKIKTLR